MDIPPPPCFWQKSSESVENKGSRVQKVRKSPQNDENTPLDSEMRLGLEIETSEVFGIFEQADGSELERGRKNLR
jgi:hypothetical protein